MTNGHAGVEGEGGQGSGRGLVGEGGCQWLSKKKKELTSQLSTLSLF